MFNSPSSESVRGSFSRKISLQRLVLRRESLLKRRQREHGRRLDDGGVLLTVVEKLAPTPFIQALQKDRVRDQKREKRRKAKLHKQDVALVGKSLGIFSPNNSFRIWLTRQVTSRKFERFIYIAVFISCISLIVDRPGLEEGSPLKVGLRSLDAVITAIFILEMAGKIISCGIVLYVSSSWNIIDASVVCIAVLNLSLSGEQNAVRALRGFRALRLITHSMNMKVVTNSLGRAFPALSNVFLVVLMVFVIFAIMGQQLFSGQFAYCQPLSEGRYTLDEGDCTGTNLDWQNPPYNFDDFGSAFLTVLEVCLLEGWTEVMFTAMDITGRGNHPVKNNAWFSAFYFVLLIVIGSVFLFSLIISIIIVQFFMAWLWARRLFLV
jgi:hypothetical protein